MQNNGQIHANGAPNYTATLQAAGSVVGTVAIGIAVLNVGMMLLREGYQTFQVAPDSNDQYHQSYQDFEEEGMSGQSLITSAQQVAFGLGAITLYGTPFEVVRKFAEASLIAGGCVLVGITLIVVAADRHGFVNGLNPVLSDERDRLRIAALAVDHQDAENIHAAGAAFPAATNNEPEFLFWFWANLARLDPQQVDTTAYQIIFAVEHFFQATKKLSTVFAYTLAVEFLIVCCGFEIYFQSQGKKPMDDTVDDWANIYSTQNTCNVSAGGTTSQNCRGYEGVYGQQAADRAIVEARVDPTTRGILFTFVLLAALPLAAQLVIDLARLANYLKEPTLRMLNNARDAAVALCATASQGPDDDDDAAPASAPAPLFRNPRGSEGSRESLLGHGSNSVDSQDGHATNATVNRQNPGHIPGQFPDLEAGVDEQMQANVDGAPNQMRFQPAYSPLVGTGMYAAPAAAPAAAAYTPPPGLSPVSNLV